MDNNDGYIRKNCRLRRLPLCILIHILRCLNVNEINIVYDSDPEYYHSIIKEHVVPFVWVSLNFCSCYSASEIIMKRFGKQVRKIRIIQFPGNPLDYCETRPAKCINQINFDNLQMLEQRIFNGNDAVVFQKIAKMAKNLKFLFLSMQPSIQLLNLDGCFPALRKLCINFSLETPYNSHTMKHLDNLEQLLHAKNQLETFKCSGFVDIRDAYPVLTKHCYRLNTFYDFLYNLLPVCKNGPDPIQNRYGCNLFICNHNNSHAHAHAHLHRYEILGNLRHLENATFILNADKPMQFMQNLIKYAHKSTNPEALRSIGILIHRHHFVYSAKPESPIALDYKWLKKLKNLNTLTFTMAEINEQNFKIISNVIPKLPQTSKIVLIADQVKAFAFPIHTVLKLHSNVQCLDVKKFTSPDCTTPLMKELKKCVENHMLEQTNNNKLKLIVDDSNGKYVDFLSNLCTIVITNKNKF